MIAFSVILTIGQVYILFHDFLQDITKLVCKTDRQALVSLIKYPATGLQSQHVWMRMFSASETDQV